MIADSGTDARPAPAPVPGVAAPLAGAAPAPFRKEPAGQRRRRTTALFGLAGPAALFAGALGALLADALLHPLGRTLTWYDFNIYVTAGQHARDAPSILYSWRLAPGVKFVYTPFAAVIFGIVSLLPPVALDWLMTAASLAAVPLTVWLTLGAMRQRGRARIAGTLAASSFALWLHPVTWSLHLGQIEPLLMLLVVWDLTRDDARRWKGAGVGLAAGVKLVPLIFIPYLLLAGKIRQAAVAAGAFAATIAVGFLVLPGPSRTWWLTGYMFDTNKNGSVISLVNQSLLAMLTRAHGGHPAGVTALWLVLGGFVAVTGVCAAALLRRSGRPGQALVLCALTGLLASPISWDNHWVWAVPLLAILTGLVMSTRRWARAVSVLAAAAIVAAFGAWPAHVTGNGAFLPTRAFLGWFSRRGSQTFSDVYHLHGLQVLTWNLYVLTGCAAFALLVLCARHEMRRWWRDWRGRRRAGDADPAPAG